MHTSYWESRTSALFAYVLIGITVLFVAFEGKETGFLVCRMDCGETEIARDAVRKFSKEGMRHGLLQNEGTVDKPLLYTHNVHFGSLLHVALFVAGIDEFGARQIFTLAGFALGLVYLFLACRAYSGSSGLALVVLFLFCTSYWGVLGFALNALRAWHFTALFGCLFHTRGFVLHEGHGRYAHALGLLICAVIAFGCGYDFWVICGLSAAAAAVLSAKLEGRPSETIRALAAIATAFVLPFVARQLQVIWILGVQFWWQDFLFSFAIKVPGAARVIAIPPLDVIDAFYRAHSILRPPASPSSSVSQILNTAMDMVREISIPRWGAISFALLIGCLAVGGMSLIPRFRNKVLQTTSGRAVVNLLVPVCAGALLGLALFAPFSLHVYLKHEFPLAAAPLLISKGIVVHHLVTRLVAGRVIWLRTSALALLAGLAVDAVASHLAALQHGRQPNLGWAETLRRQPFRGNVAVTAYWWPSMRESLGLQGFDVQVINASDTSTVAKVLSEPSTTSGRYANANSSEERLFETIRAADHWVYQAVERVHTFNFDAPAPDCSWKDPVSNALRTAFIRKDQIHYRTLAVLPAATSPGDIVSIVGEIKGDVEGVSGFEWIIPLAKEQTPRQVAPPVYNCIYKTVKAWIAIPKSFAGSAVIADLYIVLKSGERRLAERYDFRISKSNSIAPTPVIPIVTASPSVEELIKKLPQVAVLERKSSAGGYVIFNLRAMRQNTPG